MNLSRLFYKHSYFVTALRRMHDYTNQFNMKWKENQFGGKVVRQAINARPLGTKMARPAQWAMGTATNERK